MCDAGNPGDPAEASTFLTRTAPPISGVHASLPFSDFTELMTPMIYLNLIEEPHEEEIMCLVFCYDTSSSGVVFA
ncbi:hypothetical protein DY000_02012894 [Brassica cretica]|uniref:BURP domain-containing protein n=1 Tax=Brassica cretica TaxID=69181 RepID=A0ABQ7D6W5_BRACR|nr:hypothetical protein DY000_02012894 [Brassica cretica]